MKTTINNHEIECSVNEFIELLKWESGQIGENNIEKIEIFSREKKKRNTPKGATLPKQIKVIIPGRTPILCPSIRAAMFAAGYKWGDFRLANMLRENNGVAERDGITFMRVETPEPQHVVPDIIPTQAEQTDTEQKAEIRKRDTKPRRGFRGYIVFYADGDHRLIQLKPFYEEHGLPYKLIYNKTKDGNEYEYGNFKFKKREKNNH